VSAPSARRNGRLTARDYKGSTRGGLQVRGLRQFAYGAVSGIVFAGLCFAYVNARLHKGPDTADTPRVLPL
jgi:hypothetical protein